MNNAIQLAMRIFLKYKKVIVIRSPPLEKNLELFSFENFNVGDIDEIYYFNPNLNIFPDVNLFILFARIKHVGITKPIYIEISFSFEGTDCFYTVFASHNYNLIKAISEFTYQNYGDEKDDQESIFKFIWENNMNAKRLIPKKHYKYFDNFLKSKSLYDDKPYHIELTRKSLRG